MNASKRFSDIKLFERAVFIDSRGYFSEIHRADDSNFEELPTFVQDNFSLSQQGVVRGLHYQRRRPQAKLLTVLHGSILDVVVDLRRSSATFGQWYSLELSAENARSIFIPAGFAHGFSVLSTEAGVFYKCSEYFVSDDQGGLRWDDPALAIDWRVEHAIVSERDAALPVLKDLSPEALFD